MEILLEYTDESCDSSSQCVREENKNELSLSELAGLLSEQLDDAVERGLISFDNSLSLVIDKNTNRT